MKNLRLFAVAVTLSMLVAFSVQGQPQPEPKTKAPAAKAEPATKKAEPATKKVESKKEEAKPEVKIEGDIKIVTEEVKAEPKAEVKEEEPSQKWWELGLVKVVELVFLVLGIMLAAFVRVLMRKYGFEDHAAKVNDVLRKASGFAEQKALKASKLTVGEKTPGAEKMKMAVDFATSLAKEYKLPKKGSDWWEDKLESWLGVVKKG